MESSSWRADIPVVAGDNMVTVTATDAVGGVSTDTVTVRASAFVYYMAEGATGSFFDLDLALSEIQHRLGPCQHSVPQG